MEINQPPSYGYMLQVSFALMAFVTGLIDAAGYLAMGHVFTANMTGNIVLLGFAVAGAHALSIPRSLTALAFALVGGIVAGRLELSMQHRPTTQWISASMVTETSLLIAATGLCLLILRNPEMTVKGVYGLVALTALAMGIRNGTIRKLGVPDITTTVLTMTLAGLASESSLAGGSNPRWRRRVTAVFSMFLGALVGALLVRFSLALVLGLSSVIMASVSVLHLSRYDLARVNQPKT